MKSGEDAHGLALKRYEEDLRAELAELNVWLDYWRRLVESVQGRCNCIGQQLSQLESLSKWRKEGASRLDALPAVPDQDLGPAALDGDETGLVAW